MCNSKPGSGSGSVLQPDSLFRFFYLSNCCKSVKVKLVQKHESEGGDGATEECEEPSPACQAAGRR